MVIHHIPSRPGPLGGDDPADVTVFGGPRHYVCGAVGLLVAVTTLALTYSLVVGIANTVPLLSTTAITFLGIVIWVVTWIALDAVVFWASDRTSRER
jgi:hypothetical protein